MNVIFDFDPDTKEYFEGNVAGYVISEGECLAVVIQKNGKFTTRPISRILATGLASEVEPRKRQADQKLTEIFEAASMAVLADGATEVKA